MSASLIAMVTGALSLVVYGALIVLGIVFGRRSGGFLAAGGLLVLLLGNVLTGFVATYLPIDFIVVMVLSSLNSILGVVLIVAGIGFNAQKHRKSAVVRGTR